MGESRRGFLGSVLGLLVTSHVPWAAIPAPHFRGPGPGPSSEDRLLKLLLSGASDEAIMAQVRGVLFAGPGDGRGLVRIASPPIVGIDRQPGLSLGVIDLRMERVEATRPFVCGASGLIWADTGALLFPPLSVGAPLHLDRGDTLTVNQPVTFTLN